MNPMEEIIEAARGRQWICAMCGTPVARVIACEFPITGERGLRFECHKSADFLEISSAMARYRVGDRLRGFSPFGKEASMRQIDITTVIWREAWQEAREIEIRKELEAMDQVARGRFAFLPPVPPTAPSKQITQKGEYLLPEPGHRQIELE